MKHLVDSVLFLARQESAFQGHNESLCIFNKDNFKKFYKIHIVMYLLDIQNHHRYMKNVFSVLLNTIQNVLISCIDVHIVNYTKSEIKECMFFYV